MSGLLTRCALIVVLIIAAIPVTSVSSIPAGKGMADSRSSGRRSVSVAGYNGAFGIHRLTGDYKLIVILVEFSDIKHVTSHDSISEMVFGQMSRYWHEVSYGQFNVIGDTVGWLTLSHEEAYYGEDVDPKFPGSDKRDTEIVSDACRLVTGVDFSLYQDIVVVHAGHGQDSDDESTDLLWPSAYWSGLGANCGGKTFNNGGAAPEITKAGVIAAGTFTHEFGHTIGLPDLYDTNPDAPDFWKTGVGYVGLWSLMADGSWGGPDCDASIPLGLEAWTRIRAGWLTSLSVPLTSEGFAQVLNQIGYATGPRALRLEAKGGTYYLVEVREKAGADQYLPDSGVLVTRIDESKESGKGIVRVMDCHPATKTIDDATCKLNESWSDKSESIYVKVIGKQGSSYIVAVANKPITTLKVYTVELSFTGVPSSAKATITVDGVEYGTIAGIEKFTLIFPIGSNHTLTLSQYVMFGEDTRYYAAQNTIMVAKQGVYTVTYVQQNRLLIETATGTAEKWLAPNQSESLGPYDEIIQVDAGTRFLFMSIEVDGVTQQSRSFTLNMDQPHLVKVKYTKQYLLTIDSEFGDPKGGGWHNLGSEVTYFVMTPYGFLIQHIFLSWTGGITSSKPQGTLTMTRPYTIRADWRDDYTQLILAVIILAVAIAAVALRTRKRRGSVSPPPVPQELSAAKAPKTEQYGGTKRWCISCGKQILQESVFCEHCGIRQPGYAFS